MRGPSSGPHQVDVSDGPPGDLHRPDVTDAELAALRRWCIGSWPDHDAAWHAPGTSELGELVTQACRHLVASDRRSVDHDVRGVPDPDTWAHQWIYMRSIARGPRDLGGGTYTPAGWYPELQDAARRMLDALDARAAWHDRNGWPGP